jgi:hypothetical protein
MNESKNYPAELIAREPAPPHRGEGDFALWHFSEDPALRSLVPRLTLSNPKAPAAVWAVDTRHAPLYWFPRDCPRGCIWPVSTTTPADHERFFGQTAATRIHVIGNAWLERVRGCELYAYRLPNESFVPHDVGGYWVSSETVDAEERVKVGDLLNRHAEAQIELRMTPSIWKFWDLVASSTVEFSGMRLQNATR